MIDVIAESLYASLFDQAERARWRMDDIPWDRIDRSQVTPSLCATVKDIVLAELTTTTATQRFLTELADDTDFTQWIAVWFYEETKHPHVLLRWLHHVGIPVDDRFLQRGRITAPFMKSRIGMLVTNVISELVASAGYARLQATVPEPVLAMVAGKLAADEARHAASFFAYARRHLAATTDPSSDRRDALKVLYLWLNDSLQIRHPVNELRLRCSDPTVHDSIPRERIIKVIGTLLDLPLTGTTDLLAQVRDLGDESMKREDAR